MTLNEPCLSLLKDENASCFVSDTVVPNWDELKQNPMLQKVFVYNVKQIEKNQLLFQLAVAIKPHPSITKIGFHTCEIQDLGALCLAVTQKHKLATLQFSHCSLEPSAAETIRLMLEANLLESLVIHDCNRDDDATLQRTIASGLSKNQSLKVLQLTSFREGLDLNMGLPEMLINHRNLVELCLSIQSNRQWELFRAIERSQTLASLSFHFTNIDLPAMEAIMMMCHTIKPLQTLGFSHCTCDQNALEFLVRTLSNNKLINTLKYVSRQCEIDFGLLKVEKLVFEAVSFEQSTFVKMIDSLSNNSQIKCLHLGPGVLNDEEEEEEYEDETYGNVCDLILRQNLSLNELVIDTYPHSADMIRDAMVQNTCLKALSIDSVDKESLVTFARGVDRMLGLRRLAFQSNCQYSEDFFMALEESMEENTALWTLSLEGLDLEKTNAEKYLPRIRYLLAINRVGRHQMMTAPTPAGVWAHVVAKSSNEPDGINFLLTERPDIVVPSTRKRQRQGLKESYSLS